MVANTTGMESFDYPQQKQQEVTAMDVPKITVFKSPPWHKAVPHLLTPKLSDVYEEFPSKSKVFSRRIDMGMSHSLECIPENNILQDTHKYSTTHLRDGHRLSPHQVLPPIHRYPEEDLPEMRQRAHSDPHRYASSKKKIEEKRESPLGKSRPSQQPTPPSKDKHDTALQSHTISQSTHKVLRKSLSKDNPDRKSPSKSGFKSSVVTPPSSSAEFRQSSPLTSKPPKDGRVALTLNRRKVSDTNSNPTTPESQVIRNKKLMTKNMSADAIIAHPSVAALKDFNHSRSRTNSLPASLKGSNNVRRKSNTIQPIKVEEEVKTTIAYALIASPGRNRWPSPERNATSYINSDSSGSATPTDSRLSDSADSLEAIHKIVPYTQTRIEHDHSDTFKAILQDLQTTSRGDAELHAITDPKEYFQKAANWSSTA